MTLVLVGPSSNICAAAHRLDTKLILVQKPGRALASMVRPERDELFTVDYENEEALAAFAKVLRGRPEIDGVIAVSEGALQPAAWLGEELAARGPSQAAVAATRDKRVMRQLLSADAPDLTVPYADATDSEGVAAVFRASKGAILKPACGTGSQSIYELKSHEGFLALPDAARVGALVEGRLVGVEVTVETLSRRGRHTTHGVAEKWLGDNFVELGHVMPPPSLDAAQLNAVDRAVWRLLDIVGIEDGVCCTEAMVTPDGVKIVETHTRPGGDGVADLVEITTGLDWRQTAVGWVTDEIPSPGIARAPAAAVAFFTAPQGVVSRVRQDPLPVSEVEFDFWNPTVSIGDVIGPLRSSDDRLGAARFVGSTARDCAVALKAILGESVVETTWHSS